MRRLTATLLLVPVALVLLAPPAAAASSKAEHEHGAAGPGCHQQESGPPSAPSKSEHDCHHCCVSLVAGTVAPSLDAAGSLLFHARLAAGVPRVSPDAPATSILFERGPPSSSSC